jgi:hypothetical protein
MKALGRLVNPVSSPTTTATWVSLKDAAGVVFLAVGSSGTTNVTVQIAKDAAGTSAQNFAPGSTVPCDGITEYFVQHSGSWARSTQAGAATVPTTSASGDITAFEVLGVQLPDGFAYINASHASATMVLLLSDLEIERKLANLRNPTA